MNFHDDNVFYLTDFDDNMEGTIVLPLTREIQKQRQLKNGRIDLYINSFGGYAHLVNHLVVLVEAAKAEGITVRTIVPSVAFSAGSMLAITGTPGERYIDRDAEHLLHYGSNGSVESTPQQIERMTAYKTRDFKRTLKHYQKYSDVPNLETHMQDDGFFVIARDCIKWGLADKYMEKFDIGNVGDF